MGMDRETKPLSPIVGDTLPADDHLPSPPTMGPSSYTPQDLKSARRKVDLRLVVWYSFMYLVLMIHKGNISNAAIINLESGDGIRDELGGLSSSQWAWVISIFYYPYMLAEPAATLALKKFNPNVWMARIMITWGIISMCQGATQNFAGLMACRFFLGLAGECFHPFQDRSTSGKSPQMVIETLPIMS